MFVSFIGVCVCVPLPGKPAMPACLPTGYRILPSAGSAAPLPVQCHQHDSPLGGGRQKEREGAVTFTHTVVRFTVHMGMTGLSVGDVKYTQTHSTLHTESGECHL